MGNLKNFETCVSDAQSAGARAAEAYLLALYVDSWKAARGLRQKAREPSVSDIRNLDLLASQYGYHLTALKRAFKEGFLFRYKRGYPPKEYPL